MSKEVGIYTWRVSQAALRHRPGIPLIVRLVLPPNSNPFLRAPGVDQSVNTTFAFLRMFSCSATFTLSPAPNRFIPEAARMRQSYWPSSSFRRRVLRFPRTS